MQSADRHVFHLSLPVPDLATAKAFYVDALGASVGRENADWLDILIWGHQITLHAKPEQVLSVERQGVRHFGVVLPWPEWQHLVETVQRKGLGFTAAPKILLAGTIDEHAKAYLTDPGNNLIELKAYRSFAGTVRGGGTRA